jgi:hypothetical protein
VDILVVVLQDLQEYGVVEIDGHGEQVNCKDFLLIDTIYASLTFAHRKEIHKAIAAWMRSEDTAREEAVAYLAWLPNIIHHLMMSEQEASAQAVIHAVTGMSGLCGQNWLEKCLVEQVQWYLPVSVHGDEDERRAAIFRMKQALPAIPSLRGLAKAMHVELVGPRVTKAVKRFSAPLVRRRSLEDANKS